MYLHASKYKCLALMLVLLTFLALPSLAADYYVSSSGSDKTGDGTSTNPWYSVDKPDVDRILLPGDTVYISGYYSLAPEVDCLFRIRYCSGVTYKAAPGATAVFDGDTSSVAGKTIAAITANGTTLDGLRFQYFNDGVAIAAAGVTVRGCVFLTTVSATGRCIIAGGCNKLLVANNTFTRDDWSMQGYGLWTTAGCTGVRFVNNIANGVSVRIRNDDPKSAVAHNNNLYGAFSLFEGNAALGAAEFEADPSFEDFVDFVPASNSPAICAGVVIPGYSPAGRNPDLGAVQLTSPTATSWLQGTVKVRLAHGGNPTGGIRVQLDGYSTSVAVYSQPDGSYKVPLPPGSYNVTIVQDGCTDLYDSVNVSPAGTYNKDFTIDLDHPVTKYYVSVNDGDDSYDGLAETYEGGTRGPWKTIGRAKAQWDPATWSPDNPLGNITWQLQPGDAVEFLPGTYPPCEDIINQGIYAWGTEFAPITFKARPGAVLDGQGATYGFYVAWGTFPVEQYNVDTEPCRNIVIDGFEIKNVVWGVRQVMSYGLTVKNCTIHDLTPGAYPAGVQCHWVPSGPTVLNNTFYNIPAGDPSLAGVLNAGAVLSEGIGRNVVIKGNVAHDMGASLYHLLGVSWPNYDAAIIANNTVVNCLSAWSIYHSHPTIDTYSDVVNNVVVGSTAAAVINSWSTTTDLPSALMVINSSYNVFNNNAADFVLTSPGLFDFLGVDPKLDSAYQLMSGSPAIDTGADVGLPYQGNAPDRGAFESSFTGPTVLSGRVTYTDGVVAVPAIGATVTCNEMVTTVAPDGSYMLPLSAGTYSVTAEYGGATLTDAAVVAPGTKDFSFAVITGSVALDDGATITPAASAKVSIESLGVSTVADANGVYTLMVPAGSYTVTARSPFATTSASAAATAPGVRHLVLTKRDLTAGPFTYYVKTDGDDYSDGLTPATAWATIDNGDGFGIVQPGDTVQVLAGTYTYYRAWSVYGFPTSIGLTRSGTPEAPITYQAEPGVVVDGQGESHYGVWIAGAGNIKIRGFEFTNSLYGTVTQGVEGVSNVTFEDCVSRDCISEGNIVLGTANVSFIRCIVYGCGGTSCFDLRELINGVNIYNCVGVGSNRGVTLYGDAGTGVVVRNSIFMNNAQYGIRDPYETGNIDSDYNTFWATTPYYGVAQGANDQIANPLFVDAAGHDYHLTQYSPCVNTGVEVGLSYNPPAPDRGAFETDYTAVPGTLTGTVTVGGQPAANAKVVDDLGLITYTDANGYYTLWTVSGTRTVTASHGLANPATATVTVPGTYDFNLTPRSAPTTFYVKPDGDDILDGLSVDTAWASIDNGDRKGYLIPGDTIIVKPGVYNTVRAITRPDGAAMVANVQLTRGGTAGAPITYKAEPGAILDGGSSATTNFNIDTMGVSNIVIDGFEYMRSNFGIDLETNWAGFATGNVVAVENVTIRNCVGHDLGLIGVVLFGINNFVCENNVVYNITGAGEGAFELAFGGYGVIRNCTVDGMNAATNGVILYSLPGEGGSTTQVTVQNCIFSGLASNAFNDMAAGVTEDYNCIFNCGTTGTGAHDIFTNPMFVDAAAHDYHLATGSPCIDAGTDLGLPYEGLAPDMGAYEVTEAPPVEVATLREALGQPVGTNVKITTAQVATVATGVFSDGRYYVEDADRTVGIMVIPASGLPAIAEGSRVMLTGVISVDANGEKFIAATAQTPTSGAALGTLGMGGKALAGNGGLLVRVWGEVKTKTATAATIDDGSGTVVTIVLDGLVSSFDTTNIVVGKHISVSGPAGLTTGGALAVRPRALADVKVYD